MHPDLEGAAAAAVAVAAPTRRPGGRRCPGPGARGPPRARSGLVLRRLGRRRPRRRAPRSASAARRPRPSAASAAVASAASAPRRRWPRRPAPRLRAPRRRRPRPRRRRPSWRPASSGVVAPSLGSPAASLAAASKTVFLSAFGSATRRVPSGAGQALELLPVAGDLEDRGDRLGRLRADAEPVLRALGVDLDERGLLRSGGTCRSPRSPDRHAWCGSRRRRCGSTARGSCPCASA